MRVVYKNLCPTTISASIMVANMWKNSLKNVESDNNKILYKTLLDFFYCETVLTVWICLVVSYPLIAVQWHNLHVPIACLNLQSQDTLSCQTCCYLIFWTCLVYLSEVENSKYSTRNTSTTGMNKVMPLILKNNNAVGVTDEVREITWFYKQRWKLTLFVKPVNLYHEKKEDWLITEQET